MGDPDVWPLLLDMSRDDSKRILRRLELEAYSNLVSVLRAQGSLTTQKRRLLQNVAQTLSISEERHKAECRRAVNSEKLATIAKHMGGSNSGTEWAIEGRRLVPLLPRLVPQTAFTAIADKVTNMAMTEGAKLPLPTPPVKRRLTSPPIDESLLEPSVPEASKTSQVSSGSPLTLTIPSAEVLPNPQQGKFGLTCPDESTRPIQTSPPPLTQLLQGFSSVVETKPQVSIPLSSDLASPLQVRPEVTLGMVSEASVVPPVSLNHTQPIQASSLQGAKKSQVVLLVKKDDKSQEERLVRKRPRSASLDVSPNTQTQGPMMPPPLKKEAISPISPLGMTSPLSQLSSTISPQTHSQFVQQQTLQAAAAAAAASLSPSSAIQPLSPHLPPQQKQHQPQQQQQQQVQQQQQAQLLLPVPIPPPLAVPLQSASVQSRTPAAGHLQQQPLQLNSPQLQTQNPAPPTSQASSSIAGPLARTITIPTQGTVKLSLASTTPNSGSGIPSGTHKVIIVSSTTPSILQRSLSVPVVKSVSTNAPSQPCTSTLVLNTAQQIHQSTSSSTSISGSTETTSTTHTHQASTNLSSKIQGKLISQTTPKARPRTNSIVIPVTPNQANVMNSVGVTSVQLKSALQAGKQGVLKPSDTAGLKIMPLTNVSNSSKLMPKPSGSGPMYVVSTTSSAGSTVSMVARTVPSGARVMTISSSLPKVAVATSQGGNDICKSVQTLQLTQASGATSSSSLPLSSTSGKPNVIVVQKGSAAFGRGVTISHGGKEVVGKVLLGGKALTSLNQTQIQTSGSLSLNPNSNVLTSNQVLASNASQLSTVQQSSQNSLPATTTTRVVTVQKLPSAVVQGATGSGNVIVLDLSQEQLNNSAVLNEILASSILQSSSVMSFNQDSGGDSGNITLSSIKGLLNFPTDQMDTDAGILLNDDANILVEGLDHSTVNQSENKTFTAEGNITSEPLPATCEQTESSLSFIVDDISLHGGQSSNSSTTASRGRTDICAAAMSNANLNFNDLLDDGSMG